MENWKYFVGGNGIRPQWFGHKSTAERYVEREAQRLNLWLSSQSICGVQRRETCAELNQLLEEHCPSGLPQGREDFIMNKLGWRKCRECGRVLALQTPGQEFCDEECSKSHDVVSQ